MAPKWQAFTTALSIVFLVGFLAPLCRAEYAGFGLVSKGGISDYGGLEGLAGSTENSEWQSGPIFSLGVQYRTSRKVAFLGLVEYSTHKHVYAAWNMSGAYKNDERNTLVDVTCAVKYNIGFWYLLGGLGISHQKKYDRDATQVISVIGTGFDWEVTKNLTLSLEGSIKMRRYATPVAQLCFCYCLGSSW